MLKNWSANSPELTMCSVDPNDDLQLRLIGDLVPISSKNNNYGPYPAILGQITLVMLFDGAIS